MPYRQAERAVPVMFDGQPAEIIAWDDDLSGRYAILVGAESLKQHWVRWPSIRVTDRPEPTP